MHENKLFTIFFIILLTFFLWIENTINLIIYFRPVLTPIQGRRIPSSFPSLPPSSLHIVIITQTVIEIPRMSRQIFKAISFFKSPLSRWGSFRWRNVGNKNMENKPSGRRFCRTGSNQCQPDSKGLELIGNGSDKGVLLWWARSKVRFSVFGISW